MFKFIFVALAFVACVAAAPGYVGGLGHGYLGGHAIAAAPAVSYAHSYAAPAITKIAAAPAISYAAPVAKVGYAAPALGLGYGHGLAYGGLGYTHGLGLGYGHVW
ncbi:cuticle protein 16.5-like [Stomoxys calcitrans]|uniref:cuticle protein 16.5-like n=1 Tax=Stomoxys calcitrans TaxID=35570 RepID=UPI0027E358A0|nr:cuticle protein 16.5-like [Stomoxys calcitrans]